MDILIEKLGWGFGYTAGYLFVFLRYFILASIAFAIFYLWKGQPWRHRKIQKKAPSVIRMRAEILESATTAVVFVAIGGMLFFLRKAGYTQIYQDVHAYIWWYLPFSFLLLLVLHDTYFYWLHRLIHHKKLFPVFHLVHHKSNNPTPFTSLAFHPLEAIVEIAIVPILCFIIPLHPIALFAFATWSIIWNIIGHLGYEIFPAGFATHPFWRHFNTGTHHNLHHARSNCNYGLYFNWWDRWMGTNATDYIAYYQEISSQKEGIPEKSDG